jgi:drug/metabolite transporter (DMT)-like permease
MLLGILLGLAASASWAVANVFVQRSGRAVGPLRALVWAQLLGGVAMLPVVWLLDTPHAPIERATIGWGIAAALSATLAYPCLFLGASRGRLSVVIPIMSSWSIIAAGISLLILGERVRPAHLLGAALVIAGILIVSRFSQTADVPGAAPPDHDAASSDGAADSSAAARAHKAERGAMLIALGAAAGFGVLIPALGQLAPAAGRLGAVPLVYLFDLVLGVPLLAIARVDFRPPPLAAWPAVALVGVAETAGFVWISLGVARAPVAIVSPLAGLSSAMTVVFAWAFLGERPRPAVLAGAALASAGVVVLAL